MVVVVRMGVFFFSLHPNRSMERQDQARMDVLSLSVQNKGSIKIRARSDSPAVRYYAALPNPTPCTLLDSVSNLNALPNEIHRHSLRSRIYSPLHAAGRNGCGVECAGAV